MPVALAKGHMAERKGCIRCQRQIDAYARICPYCNWDQEDRSVPAETVQATTSQYIPPAETNWRKYVAIAGGGVFMLIAAFLVGMWINSDAAPKNAPEPVSDQDAPAPVRPAPRADVTLVPVTDVDQPITTAPVANPAEGVPTEYQRTDATAVSAAEYAQLAVKANEEKKKRAALVDPRSLTGPAYSQTQARSDLPAARSRRPPVATEPDTMTSASTERARVVVRTRPVPVSQPLPDIRVTRNVIARLDLKIDADGRVREVNLRDTIPGHTAEVVAAVQRWRFKPATENGEAVPSSFSVELSFRGSD